MVLVTGIITVSSGSPIFGGPGEVGLPLGRHRLEGHRVAAGGDLHGLERHGRRTGRGGDGGRVVTRDDGGGVGGSGRGVRDLGGGGRPGGGRGGGRGRR